MATEIEIVPCLSDNYAYLVKSGEACAVPLHIGDGGGRARAARAGERLAETVRHPDRLAAVEAHSGRRHGSGCHYSQVLGRTSLARSTSAMRRASSGAILAIVR